MHRLALGLLVLLFALRTAVASPDEAPRLPPALAHVPDPVTSRMKPSKALTAKVKKVLLAKKAKLVTCVFSKLPRGLDDVRVKVNVDVTAAGVISVQPLGQGGPKNDAIAVCAHDAVKELDSRVVGVAQVLISLRRPLRPVADRHDGKEGAICRFGEHRRTPNDELNVDSVGRFPVPRACRPGLLCCGGGAFGSDSHCVRTKSCPPLP